MASCDQGDSDQAWHRRDLTTESPRVVLSPFSNAARTVHRSTVTFLGAEEVRDRALVPLETLTTFPRQSAGQVRALEQAVGSRLAWKVLPNASTYLAFTPLPDLTHPSHLLFRVGVEAAGRIEEIHRIRLTSPPAGAPALAEEAQWVSLSRWAGQEVSLLVQVDPPEGIAPPPGGPEVWGRWASLALYERRTAPASTATASRPNVILVGIDTLRADHVGAFRRDNSSPSLTPALDRLAGESDVFLDAYSTFNITNPSFASMLTGLFGKNHGVYDLKTPLPAEHTTLAEVFRAGGYDTLAVISARHLGDHNSGLGQGFDQVARADEHYAAELGVETAMDWIADRKSPFFAWVHLFDPHTPHTPPRPFAQGERPATASGLGPVTEWLPFRPPGGEAYDQIVLAGNRRLYEGEVAYLDRQIDRLLSFLDSRGLLLNTVIAVTADHGENLGEHGFWYRHIGLWETTTHVPLLVRYPGKKPVGRRFKGFVQTIDLFPTLLAAAGLAVPAQDGLDLRSEESRAGRLRPVVFGEDASRFGLTVRAAHWRYVRSAGNPSIADGPHLYDLEKDPGETVDLAGQGLAAEHDLAAVLDRWLADRRNAPNTAGRELSPEEIERLRALGYL